MIRRLEGDFINNTFVFSGTELFAHAFVGVIINKISLNVAYLIAFMTAGSASLLYVFTRVSLP